MVVLMVRIFVSPIIGFGNIVAIQAVIIHLGNT